MILSISIVNQNGAFRETKVFLKNPEIDLRQDLYFLRDVIFTFAKKISAFTSKENVKMLKILNQLEILPNE